MRVNLICILPFTHSTTGSISPAPDVMDEVVGTADGTYIEENGSETACWQLEGYPEDWGYDKRNFAILPDQTVDEINGQHTEAILM